MGCGHGSDYKLGHHLGKENAKVPGSIPGAVAERLFLLFHGPGGAMGHGKCFFGGEGGGAPQALE